MNRSDTHPRDQALRVHARTRPNPEIAGQAVMAAHHDVPEGRVLHSRLDHTIWFHQHPRVDQWLLYDQRSAWAGGGRALCRGRSWSSDGRLVATVAQEGLVRQR